MLLNDQRCSLLFQKFYSAMTTQQQLLTAVGEGDNNVDRTTMFAIVISWFFGLVTSSCQDNMLYISCEDNVVVLTFFYMRQNAPTSCKLTTGVNNVALPTVNNVCAAHCEHCCQQSCLAMKTMCRLQKHSLTIFYGNQWLN